VVAGEIAATEDKALVDRLQMKMAKTNNLLDLDDQFLPSLANETDESSDADSHQKHQSLVTSCPTRWNFVLEMIDSVVQLQREVVTAVKCIGRIDFCLHQDEIDFLTELVKFLKPF